MLTCHLCPFQAANTCFEFCKRPGAQYHWITRVAQAEQSFCSHLRRLWSLCWLLQCRFESDQPNIRAIWFLRDGRWHRRRHSDFCWPRGFSICLALCRSHKTIPSNDKIVGPLDRNRLRYTYLYARNAYSRWTLYHLCNTRSSFFLLASLCARVSC